MQSSIVQKPRIGIFDYVNIWPVYYDFLFRNETEAAQSFELVYGTPAELNDRFIAGELLASSLSSNQVPFLEENRRIIRTAGLASTGSVQSVLLVSRLPIEELAEEVIVATEASSTSHVLLEILLHEMNVNAGIAVSADPFAQLKSGAKAALFIGDDALRAARIHSDLFQYDLGKLWTEITGKPFVWAVWGVQADRLNEAPRILEILSESCQHGVGQLSELAVKASRRLGIEADILEDYYRNFDYQLTEEHLEGLYLFYKMAHKLDLSPPCDSIRFAETAVSCLKR